MKYCKILVNLQYIIHEFDIENRSFLTTGKMSSSPVFSEVRVTRSLILYVCFADRCLSFCTFSVGH